MRTIVHVTHEAVHKIGGIGAVLEGLITARHYDKVVQRTILLGPLFSQDGDVNTRLGRDGEVLYSPIDGRYHHPAADALRDVQNRFGVQIIYGRRHFKAVDTGHVVSPEVLLIDVTQMDPGPLNLLKHRFYEQFGFSSDRYQDVWEFEQYMRLALPGLAAVAALGACGPGRECVIFAHEFMGMPTALAALANPTCHCATVFQAHEVATIRRIVEEHPGQDTMFYNAMRQARREGVYLEDVFGPQDSYFKHPLIKAARHCHNILAVGDYVVDELRFLGPEFDSVPISLTYNGVPAYKATAEQDEASGKRLQDYAMSLLGFRPDYVFTHVTRLVRSKGLWRDLDVMRHLEPMLRQDNQTAVLFVLSTEIGSPRRAADVRRMERLWDWPVAHREGMPDLSHGEAEFHVGVQSFNARSRNAKVVFINQFGFERELCGERMSGQMEFWDIRRGSDLEFGQSIYEPFGIAQVEAMSFGCVCVMSEVCGCAGFVNRLTNGTPEPNAIIADYTSLQRPIRNWRDALTIQSADRHEVEQRVSRQVAAWIHAHLPRTPADSAAILERGHEIASRMSWEVVARDYVMPAVEEALRRMERTAVPA